MKLETKLILCLAYFITAVAFVALRTENSDKDNSLDCVRNKQQWHEPHGISPGWCGH